MVLRMSIAGPNGTGTSLCARSGASLDDDSICCQLWVPPAEVRCIRGGSDPARQ